MKNQSWYLIAVLIVVGFLSRVIPHPPNLTAIGAVAFASGVWLEKGPLKFLLPLMALVLSDLVLGFHQTQWFVYFGFILTVALGQKFSEEKITLKILGLSVGTFAFFLVSNFGVWITSEFYVKSFSGLVSAYFAGLPFLPQQFVGDVIYFLGLSYAFEQLAQRARSQT